MVMIFTSGVVVASTTLFTMIFLIKDNPGMLSVLPSGTPFLNGGAAYSLFFFSQGRVYALTILVNFKVGVPGPPTRTVSSPPGTALTPVVFRVDYQASENHNEAPTYSSVRPHPFRRVRPNFLYRIGVAS